MLPPPFHQAAVQAIRGVQVAADLDSPGGRDAARSHRVEAGGLDEGLHLDRRRGVVGRLEQDRGPRLSIGAGRQQGCGERSKRLGEPSSLRNPARNHSARSKLARHCSADVSSSNSPPGVTHSGRYGRGRSHRGPVTIYLGDARDACVSCLAGVKPPVPLRIPVRDWPGNHARRRAPRWGVPATADGLRHGP